MKTFDISWRRYLLPNIHNEGWKFVGVFAAVSAVLAMIWSPLGKSDLPESCARSIACWCGSRKRSDWASAGAFCLNSA